MKRFCSLLLTLALISSGPVLAQWAAYPTGDLDARTVRTQAKVEKLYARGDYKRAHFIYANELSLQGDKYAQYMTGYMYLMGQGVEQDRVRASAWYRLAAERRVPEFMAVRDQALRSLTPEQHARCDELYVELRKAYSDPVVVMGQLEKDLRALNRPTTGSRLAGSSGMVTVIDPKTGMPDSPDHIRNRDLRTVQKRLDFITARLGIDSIKATEADEHIDILWERVRDFVSVVDDIADGPDDAS